MYQFLGQAFILRNKKIKLGPVMLDMNHLKSNNKPVLPPKIQAKSVI